MPSTQPAGPVELRAGPLRLTLQDGELRYLRVGDREVVRRIYFAVRDGQWNTAMPRFTGMKVDDRSDGFTVTLAAECRREQVDYRWSGRIEGSPDGRITFHAEGAPAADFQSNRIGLCVLYGASLVGEKFDTSESADGSGEAVHSEFPRLVSPSSKLVGKHFRLLRYACDQGLRVACSVEGAVFDMEDQRNWGDSSFKAYAPLPYAYPTVKAGDRKEQTVTLTVQNVPPDLGKYVESNALRVRIGDPLEGAKVPRLVGHDKSFDGAPAFVEINNSRPKFAEAGAVTWPYTSATHLPDDDTLTENPPALIDQAKTMRSFAPGAALRVGPVRLESSPGARDPRRASPLAAAWAAEVVRALALGGAQEAEFDVGPGPGDAVLADFRAYAGKPVLSAEAERAPGAGRAAFAVQALAVRGDDGPVVWLLNRSPRKYQVVVEGVGASAKVWRIGASAAEPVKAGPDAAGGTVVTVDLDGYEVCRLASAKP